MRDITRFAQDLLVIILVAFPPFLYLYRYIYNKVKNLFIRLLIYSAYWAGTFLFSNVFPALGVLLLIFVSRNQPKEEYRNFVDIQNTGNYKFNLDCTGPKWKFSSTVFLWVSFLGLFIKGAVTYINILVINLLAKFNITLTNQEIVNQFLKSDLIQSIIYSVLIIICAPIVEEFAFRFWLYDRVMKKRIGRGFAIIFTSLLFMAAHFNIQGAAAFFLIGVVNCFLYDKYGYWGAVANHFIFNFTSALALIIVKIFGIDM